MTDSKDGQLLKSAFGGLAQALVAHAHGRTATPPKPASVLAEREKIRQLLAMARRVAISRYPGPMSNEVSAQAGIFVQGAIEAALVQSRGFVFMRAERSIAELQKQLGDGNVVTITGRGNDWYYGTLEQVRGNFPPQ